MKTTAKILLVLTAILLVPTTFVYAGAGALVAESGLLVWALIGFATLVVLMQFVPSLILMVSMLKGLFAAPEKLHTNIK